MTKSNGLLALAALTLVVVTVWSLGSSESNSSQAEEFRQHRQKETETGGASGVSSFPKNREVKSSSQSVIIDPVEQNRNEVALVSSINSHGTAEFLDARDLAFEMVEIGYESLRWNLFQFSGQTLDSIVDGAANVSEDSKSLGMSVSVIPFEDDPCTLTELSAVPLRGASSSEVWTIRGRCNEKRSRKITLKISSKDDQIRGRVSSGGLLHYEIIFVSSGYVIVSEVDRSKLPFNKH